MEQSAMRARHLRLGVNIDHVATVRNARGGAHPDPVRAAHEAIAAGADGITAHLREDRRHIRDDDVARLMAEIVVPLNLEAALTPEMLAIAVRTRPHAVCLVPEKREERTTEGGLDIIGLKENVRDAVARLSDAGIRVSLFVEPDRAVMETAAEVGAPVVELHTGTYCEAFMAADKSLAAELARLREAAAYGASLGLEIHAGHGLTTDSVGPVAAIPEVAELNIGHFIIGEAIFSGLGAAIRSMRQAMELGRNSTAEGPGRGAG